MANKTQIICIGSVLWDVIGRAPSSMRVGSDVPGRITRIPGGVALNIAMTLRKFGISPVLVSAIGRDGEGEDLIARCDSMGMDTQYLYRSEDLPTDIYMAIEGSNGLIAAIADAHSLEAAGDKILQPLRDGRLGSIDAPYPGLIALDGNLTETLLATIAISPLFASADLRIAPASPGKAERLMPLLGCPNATFYVNKEEASLICRAEFKTAKDAAAEMANRGGARVLVTDGGNPAADAHNGTVTVASPPQVMVTRVTGAGDTFMAGHIAAEAKGETGDKALKTALRAAADYVSGDVPS